MKRKGSLLPRYTFIDMVDIEHPISWTITLRFGSLRRMVFITSKQVKYIPSLRSLTRFPYRDCFSRYRSLPHLHNLRIHSQKSSPPASSPRGLPLRHRLNHRTISTDPSSKRDQSPQCANLSSSTGRRVSAPHNRYRIPFKSKTNLDFDGR